MVVSERVVLVLQLVLSLNVSDLLTIFGVTYLIIIVITSSWRFSSASKTDLLCARLTLSNA